MKDDENILWPQATRQETEVAQAWATHQQFVRRLVDDAELSAESAELLLSEDGRQRWIRAHLLSLKNWE